MPTELAQKFRADLDGISAVLRSVFPELADIPWRPGGWTRKQIVGHLLDSAANNRQRFVRAATASSYIGPAYDQDAWVAMHGYTQKDWATLLRWWETEHEILASAVDGIPEDHLETPCTVGEGAPVTLRFLVEDYIEHQKWHLAQITAEAPVA